MRLVAKRYLYYYCFFVIINIILEIVWKFNQIGSISELGANLVKWILASLYCYPYMDYMPNCSPIWFLLCLFPVTVTDVGIQVEMGRSGYYSRSQYILQ